MNIYLVKRPDIAGYDEYDSFVCFAETAEQAANMTPDESDIPEEWPASPSDLIVKHLGIAREGAAYGVIIASYNAG